MRTMRTSGTPRVGQSHRGERIALVEIHDVGDRLIIAPENAGRRGDAVGGGAETASRDECKPDLQDGRTDGNQRDARACSAEHGLEFQRTVEQVDRQRGAEAVADDDDLVRLAFARNVDEFARRAVELGFYRAIAVANIVSGENPVVEQQMQKHAAAGPLPEQGSHSNGDHDADR